MSQEVAVFQEAPLAFTAPQETLAAVLEAFSLSLNTGTLSIFDMPKIKVQAAGWEIPTLDGKGKTLPTIEGVIVFQRDIRAYYKDPNAGKVPPDCSSSDCRTGIGTPGGQCASCPFAKFKSAADGVGQACKLIKQLFVLRGESLFPEIVSLPPTSAAVARKVFAQLITQGISWNRALLKMSIDKLENPQKKVYGRVVFDIVRRLTPDESKVSETFYGLCEELCKMPSGLSAAPDDAVIDATAQDMA
jgi:hypothetical protein